MIATQSIPAIAPMTFLGILAGDSCGKESGISALRSVVSGTRVRNHDWNGAEYNPGGIIYGGGAWHGDQARIEQRPRAGEGVDRRHRAGGGAAVDQCIETADCVRPRRGDARRA